MFPALVYRAREAVAGVVEIPVITVAGEKKETVRIQRGGTKMVSVQNVEPDPAYQANHPPPPRWPVAGITNLRGGILSTLRIRPKEYLKRAGSRPGQRPRFMAAPAPGIGCGFDLFFRA